MCEYRLRPQGFRPEGVFLEHLLKGNVALVRNGLSFDDEIASHGFNLLDGRWNVSGRMGDQEAQYWVDEQGKRRIMGETTAAAYENGQHTYGEYWVGVIEVDEDDSLVVVAFRGFETIFNSLTSIHRQAPE